MVSQTYLFPFKPDWSNGLEETIEFLTEVFEAGGGREQRRARRHFPRTNLSFRVSEHGDRVRDFSRRIGLRVGEIFALPHPAYKTTLSLPASSPSTIFNVSETPEWLVSGASFVLENSGVYELVTATDVTGTQVTIDSPLASNKTAGTKVYMAFWGVVSSATVKYLTSIAAEALVSFDGIPGMNYDFIEGMSGDLFGDKEIFETKPNWANGIEIEFTTNKQKVDYGFGVVDFFASIPFDKRIQKLGYLGKTADEVYSLKQFFLRQKGRRGEFYCPDWVSELRPVSGIGSAESTLEIYGSNNADYDSDPVYTGIYLNTSQGSYYRKVSSVVANGENATITVDAPWGDDIPIEDIKSVCWLPVQRFAVDSLQINWITNEVAQTQMSFQSLEDVDG